ncbi:hypothetical protein [Mucilaginibacter sp.]|uniref:hypothetical protein n=1 Tax=Mucilaginibacter sp. TaxID=1882438 RepID=UPI0035BC592E
MQRLKRANFKQVLGIIVLTVLFNIHAIAQDCDEGPTLPGDNPDVGNPCSVPLDTWVYILVFAAIIFGVYQLHKKDKKGSISAN